MRSDAGDQTPALLPLLRLACEILEAFETSSRCTEAKTEARSRSPTTPKSSNQNSSAGLSAVLLSTSTRLGHRKFCPSCSPLLPSSPASLSCSCRGPLGQEAFAS